MGKTSGKEESSSGKKGGSGNGSSAPGLSIKVKRKHIHLTGDDKYGHWWTEIGPSESYGWWPKNPKVHLHVPE